MPLEIIIGLILSIISFLLILVFLLYKNEPFFNFNKIIKDHLMLFKDCKLQYLVFYFFPFILAVGLSLLFTVNVSFFSHLGIVVSIILTILFTLMSMLTNFDISKIEDIGQKKKVKEAIRQTINAIFFDCIIGIFLLLLGFVSIAAGGNNLQWIPFDTHICKIILSIITYYLLSVVLLTLLLIIKNISKIILLNLTIERKNK